MLKLSEINIVESQEVLRNVPKGKILVNTVNAHSFNIAQKYAIFAKALQKGDYLIADGTSIVWACKYLKSKSQPRG